ncbi:hypothetical protein E5Q_03714 [Mixia osmundae IAM 14324]|uniref:Cyclin-like domain-containing protein n=1 Tax=Mixia osmundae (strain CBS 9802 / IAM 14324 / JCM 22182 / KY 12970) TaxID=764103 RepID=G7E2H9_MIXOS|nr:hypothetical protein E5Q_03714 [Mixia osmundae IAM 14324]
MGAEVEPLPLYEQSSQDRDWRFSVSSLAKMRQDLNRAAIQRIKSTLEEDRAATSAGTESDAADPSELTFLSVQDEQALVSFYLTKIAQISQAPFFRFSHTVESTAMTFLKRFYLRNTCMDYHPKKIMLTCLFLATKTENQMVPIDFFASKLKEDQAAILSLEFVISQSLKFQYSVHGAHNALRGLSLDLQSLPGLDETRSAGALERARETVKASRLTDLEFVFPPSQIALLALWQADTELAEQWLQSKLDRLQPHQGQLKEMSALGNVLTTAQELLASQSAQCTAATTEVVRTIDKRLRLCTNPAKDPNSAISKKRQAQVEAEQLEKKRAKAETHAAKVEEEDPFN